MLQRQLFGHLAVLHLPGGVVVADALLRFAVEEDSEVMSAVAGDGARLAICNHAATDAGRHA
ncbi:hypothetical protein D3C81_2153210 [compost metagenome]